MSKTTPSPEAAFLREMLAEREWLDQPTIQRAFRYRFKTIAYKRAMKELKATETIESRYVDRFGKKCWWYRLSAGT